MTNPASSGVCRLNGYCFQCSSRGLTKLPGVGWQSRTCFLFDRKRSTHGSQLLATWSLFQTSRTLLPGKIRGYGSGFVFDRTRISRGPDSFRLSSKEYTILSEHPELSIAWRESKSFDPYRRVQAVLRPTRRPAISLHNARLSTSGWIPIPLQHFCPVWFDGSDSRFV